MLDIFYVRFLSGLQLELNESICRRYHITGMTGRKMKNSGKLRSAVMTNFAEGLFKTSSSYFALCLVLAVL